VSGCQWVNAQWLAKLNDKSQLPNDETPLNKVKDFLVAKYTDKRWYHQVRWFKSLASDDMTPRIRQSTHLLQAQQRPLRTTHKRTNNNHQRCPQPRSHEKTQRQRPKQSTSSRLATRPPRHRHRRQQLPITHSWISSAVVESLRPHKRRNNIRSATANSL
jgi:hypothetical protein